MRRNLNATRSARQLLAIMCCTLILVAFWGMTGRDQQALAAGDFAVSAPAGASTTVGEPVQLDGFTIVAPVPIRATLRIDPPSGGALTLACGSRCSGVTFVDGDGTDDAVMVMTGDASAVSAAVGRLTASPSAAGTFVVSLHAIERDARRFGEHYYEYVSNPMTWSAALDAAAARQFHGLDGYLVTITSSGEDDFVRRLRLNSTIHVGASDADVEGEWRWVTGPDAGRLFWTPACGTGLVGDCADTGGYSAWRPGEPNDEGGDGDVMTQRVSGWNDVSPASACCSYVVEYGGAGGTLDLPRAATTVEVVSADTSTTSAPPPSTPPPSTTQPPPTEPSTTTTSTSDSTAPPETSEPESSVPDTSTPPRTSVAPASSSTTDPSSSPSPTDPATEPSRRPDTPAASERPLPSPTFAAPAPGAVVSFGADTSVAPNEATAAATIPNSELGQSGTASPATADDAPAPAADGATSGGGGDPATITVESDPGTTTARIDIEIDGKIGDPATGRTVRFSGNGLPANLPVRAIVRSDPIEIGSTTTAADGSFDLSAQLPDGLAPGDHRLQIIGPDDTVYATGRFSVRPDGSLGGAQRSLGLLPADPYDPAQDTGRVIGIGIAGAVLLGAAASSRSSSSNPPQAEVQMGSVSELDARFHRLEVDADEPSDGRTTWRWPGTARVDRWSTAIPARLDRTLPLVARVIGDGNYLRAMFGTAALAVPTAGALLGLLGAADVGFDAFPPSVWLLATIVVLSSLDALAGWAAATTYAAATLIGGGVTGDRTLLGVFGTAVLMIGAPLVASTVRPLARRPDPSRKGRWDRTADAIVASLIAGWAVKAMAGALPGLRGLQLPIADHAATLGWFAVAAITVRVLGESMAANWYPSRVRQLTIDVFETPSRLRRLVIVAERVALFLLAAYRFVGVNWQLWVGAAIYAIPQILPLLDRHLPSSEALFRRLPRGLLKSAIMLLIGTLWARWLAGRIDGGDLLRTMFVVLPIPGLVVAVLAAFGRDGPRPTLGWWHRIGGGVVFAFAVATALGYVV